MVQGPLQTFLSSTFEEIRYFVHCGTQQKLLAQVCFVIYICAQTFKKHIIIRKNQ